MGNVEGHCGRSRERYALELGLVLVCSDFSTLTASSLFLEAVAQQPPSTPEVLETAELAASAIATEVATGPSQASLGSPVIKMKGPPSITMKLSPSTQQPSRLGFFGKIIYGTAAMSASESDGDSDSGEVINYA